MWRRQSRAREKHSQKTKEYNQRSLKEEGFFSGFLRNMETLYDDTDDERQEKRGTVYNSFIIGTVNTALVFHCITWVSIWAGY